MVHYSGHEKQCVVGVGGLMVPLRMPSPTEGCMQGVVWAGPSQDPLRVKILLPSAVHLEERLTVSQSVPEPASRQSDRYTQFGFFVSGRCGPKQRGGPSP